MPIRNTFPGSYIIYNMEGFLSKKREKRRENGAETGFFKKFQKNQKKFKKALDK